jgi:hypothetical protein
VKEGGHVDNWLRNADRRNQARAEEDARDSFAPIRRHRTLVIGSSLCLAVLFALGGHWPLALGEVIVTAIVVAMLAVTRQGGS